MHFIAFLLQCLNISCYGLLPNIELWRLVEDIRLWVQDFADLLSYFWPIAVSSGNYNNCLTTVTSGPSQHRREQNIDLLSKTQVVVQSRRHHTGCSLADGNCSPPFWSHEKVMFCQQFWSIIILNVRISARVLKNRSFSLLFISFNRNSEHKMSVSINCLLKYLSMSDVLQLDRLIWCVQFVL